MKILKKQTIKIKNQKDKIKHLMQKNKNCFKNKHKKMKKLKNYKINMIKYQI